jgi:hypothetical protein
LPLLSRVEAELKMFIQMITDDYFCSFYTEDKQHHIQVLKKQAEQPIG